jgi:GNAT superfamily N-acetyltransferase
MQFELNGALLNDILFSMEDQAGGFLLDTQEGIVIKIESKNLLEGGRYISLPGWGPSDGFRLMERFASTLRNALVREELSGALERGRGVFRAFKNTLGRYPEAEKLWHAYKGRELKRVVISWYNALRESWGLELLGEEPEDISGLALEDFRLREGGPLDKPLALALHESCCKQEGPIISGMGDWVFPSDISFVAESAGKEFAGYISASVAPGGPLRVLALEVRPEYRGLGLGKALVSRLLEAADKMGLQTVCIDVPAAFGHFSRALLREAFRPAVMRYERSLMPH